MAIQNDKQDPTTVPHDEPTETEAAGRTAETQINVPTAPTEGGTTVPHDDA